MAFWITVRSPKRFLQQHDLHAIIGAGLAHLLLAMQGVLTDQGSVFSPFFQPFTGSSEMMLFGIGLYIIVLGVGSLMLGGLLRKWVASTLFGIHVIGIMHWSHLIAPDLHAELNLFYYAVAGTMSTAMFYTAEDYAHRRKKRKKQKAKEEEEADN